MRQRSNLCLEANDLVHDHEPWHPENLASSEHGSSSIRSLHETRSDADRRISASIIDFLCAVLFPTPGPGSDGAVAFGEMLSLDSRPSRPLAWGSAHAWLAAQGRVVCALYDVARGR